MRKFIYLFAILAMAFACTPEDGVDGINGVDGAQGIQGIQGENGVDGVDGETPRVSILSNQAAADLSIVAGQDCSGIDGQVVIFWFDNNDDGILNEGENVEHYLVCDGVDGASGDGTTETAEELFRRVLTSGQFFGLSATPTYSSITFQPSISNDNFVTFNEDAVDQRFIVSVVFDSAKNLIIESAQGIIIAKASDNYELISIANGEIYQIVI